MHHRRLLTDLSAMESPTPTRAPPTPAAAADASYPPFLLLQSDGAAAPAGPSAASPSWSKAAIDVPVIDLGRLDPAALREACRGWGLFRLVNHGIPPPLTAAIQDQARALLGLPFEDKAARFSRPGCFYFWGTPALTLSVKEINWLEGLHIPLARLRSVGSAADFDGLEDLRSLVDEYGQHMARVSRTLFEAMAADLKLGVDMLSSYLREHDGTFRVYRYPKCPDFAGHFAMEPHTDSSVLSVVNQDVVGGLQLLRDGRWFDVEPVAGSLIVNLGDLIQAMSDDKYTSVEHRVVVSREKERISLCYFAFPTEGCMIGGGSSSYRRFTYKEFKDQVADELKASGVKVGLRKFKVGGVGVE